MTGDSFYQSILDGLAKLDESHGKLFESCMVELLRPQYGTLIPVPGGDDAGMDGAWYDENGPGLLVATVSADLLKNVTKNLRSHLNKGGHRRQVLIVTSQTPTQAKCRSVIARVDELGFTLAHHPFTREAIATLLLREPEICRRLLGLGGNPIALAKIPMGHRPLRDLPLIGREDDLTWLKETLGDRLLVGQPGIGKTFLLQRLAQDGLGLFVVRDDLDAVVDAIRREQPKALIVEDAHTRTNFLRELYFYRASTQTKFDVIADCWPGASAMVSALMTVAEPSIHVLDRLLPKQIAELVRAAGIARPDFLIDQIIRQADGRPGLAALLSHLALSGGAGEVWRGDVLGREIQTKFTDLVGEEATQVLGAFALGGTEGMRVEDVASLLGYANGQLRLLVSKLAAGGVIVDLGDDVIAVQPEPLRCVLVRDMFFARPSRLPLNAFLDRLRSREAAVLTMVGAYARGADIAVADLLRYVRDWGPTEAWKRFAWADANAARAVFYGHPERCVDAAAPLLHHLPDETINYMFTASSGQNPVRTSAITAIRDALDGWVGELDLTDDEALHRRKRLLQGATKALKSGGDNELAFRAIQTALKPTFQCMRGVPGDPLAVSHCSGILSVPLLRSLGESWNEVVQSIQGLPVRHWTRLLNLLDEWTWPNRAPVKIPPEVFSLCRGVAAKMLADLANAATKRPGVLRHLRQIAMVLEVTQPRLVDQVFEVIYPADDFVREVETKTARRMRAAEALADQWANAEPGVVASELVRCATEARDVDLKHGGLSYAICNRIVELTSRPLDWFDAFVEAGVDSALVDAFLLKAAALNVEGWHARAERCLKESRLQPLGTATILKSEAAPDWLVDAALECSAGLQSLVQRHYSLSSFPISRLRRLLLHPDATVAGKTAIGLYSDQPGQPIPSEVLDEWRAAILRARNDDYWIGEILKQHRELAFDWLIGAIQGDKVSLYEFDQSVLPALSVLDQRQRIRMLKHIPPTYGYSDFVKLLVGASADVYAALLGTPELARLHLAPLAGHPNDAWAKMARLALDAGHTPSEIVDATFGHSYSWAGSEAAMWQQWVDAWGKLMGHGDPEIAAIAGRGRLSAEARQRAAAKAERARLMRLEP